MVNMAVLARDLNLERLQYPSLVDWQILDDCENRHLANVAKYICKTISEFNNASKAFRRLVSEKKEIEDKFLTFSEQHKKSNKCQNCELLQRRLDDEIEKVNKTDLPHKIFTESCDAVKANIVATAVEIPNNDQNKKPSPKCKQIGHNVLMKTPSKKLNVRKSTENNKDNTGEIEETLIDDPISPILRKCKVNKISKINKGDSPMEMSNRKERNPLVFPKKILLPDKENNVFSSSFPSFVENDITNISSSASPTEDLFQSKINRKDSILPKRKRKIVSNSPHSTKKSKKCNKNNQLKQCRLKFKTTRPTLSLDVTKTDNFLGGVRNIPNNSFRESKMDIDKSNIFIKPDIDGVSAENADIIDESPSCISRKLPKNPKISSIRPSLFCDNAYDTKDAKKNEAVILTTVKTRENDEKINQPIDSQNSKHPPVLKNNIISPLKQSHQGRIYIEEPIRKKVDKAKVPGWSCKKCSDFYNIAFKGNEEMIQKKIHQCSKHRGKFNPERRNTPPGFWDVDIPPTPINNTFNNQDN